jgi:hypothetical protein
LNLSSDGHEAKVPVVKRPEYTVSLEQINPETAFLHCTILVPWTGRVRRKFTDDLDQLYALHGGPFYAFASPDDIKLHRFLKQVCGAEFVAYFTDLSEGRTKLIFKR